MDLEEFEAQRLTLQCRHCHHVGLESARNPNNGGVRPICTSCGSPSPLNGIQWLRQHSAKSRQVKRPPGDPSAAAVWAANGNSCAFCGKTSEECERYGIGITKQHVLMFSEGGEDGPMIPFCVRCQQASTAAQAETVRIRRVVDTIQEQLTRLQEKQRELDTRRGA